MAEGDSILSRKTGKCPDVDEASSQRSEPREQVVYMERPLREREHLDPVSSPVPDSSFLFMKILRGSRDRIPEPM